MVLPLSKVFHNHFLLGVIERIRFPGKFVRRIFSLLWFFNHFVRPGSPVRHLCLHLLVAFGIAWAVSGIILVASFSGIFKQDIARMEKAPGWVESDIHIKLLDAFVVFDHGSMAPNDISNFPHDWKIFHSLGEARD